jgi:uncharacterized protein YndB with AHSA1/START domain
VSARSRWRGAAAILGTALLLPAAAGAEDRLLRADVEIFAPIDSVWAVWTTEAGVRSFFAPGCRIEPRVDGAYEIWFMPSAPAGERGGDSLRVLAFEPNRRLAFTWNAPPSLPAARAQRTMVIVDLLPHGKSRTHVRFTHLGWGEGPDWDAAYNYFDQAWNGVVLPRLVYRFEQGPVDWEHPPELAPVVSTMKVSLVPAPAPG